MSEYVIKTEGLSKKFGRNEVLSDLALQVPKGSVYGFLGRNGAGKTTTIKILLGLIPFNTGGASVLSMNSAKSGQKIRRLTGYVPERHNMYGWMKIREIVNFVSHFYPTWDKSYSENFLKKFQLDPEKKIKDLSRGMEAKVALTLALSHNPEILILDDPTMGLDSIVRKEFLDSVVSVIQEEGRTVFFSSHIIEEVERVADHIGIISEGRLKIQKPLDKLKSSMKRIRIVFDQDAAEKISGLDIPVLNTEKLGREVILTTKHFSHENLEKIKNVNPENLEVEDLTLDEIFTALEG